MRKSKWNPSGKPILVKNLKNRGAFLKAVKEHKKKLNRSLKLKK